MEERQKDVPFDLSFAPGKEENFFKSKEGSKSFKGNRCSANSTHMFILPDGQVSICEQFYWNSRFLIGDLKRQSISEVWNSPKALHLANLKECDYSDESACKTCKMLETCNSFMNKCYTFVIKAYEDEHWDYPDPRCYYAPRDISDSLCV